MRVITCKSKDVEGYCAKLRKILDLVEAWVDVGEVAMEEVRLHNDYQDAQQALKGWVRNVTLSVELNEMSKVLLIMNTTFLALLIKTSQK
jgi:hypothetical protein